MRALFVRSSLWLVALAACGGSGDGNPPSSVSISIQVPTNAPTFTTNVGSIGLGGTIAGAAFVHLRNERTNQTSEGFVNFTGGQGTWFGELGLAAGDNPLAVVADEDGLGTHTAIARIVVTAN